MSPIDTLKSEAVALRAKEKASGRLLKHCDALEQVAKKHGYANWRACCAILEDASKADTPVPTDLDQPNVGVMKRYNSSEWNFALDIPERWNSFPPVLTNSPYEVIRFASHEDGVHVLIVFRQPYDPKNALRGYLEKVQQILVGKGFGNFVTASTTIGSKEALTLDFDKPQGDGTWSCRQYSVAEGTLVFTLGFGTNKKARVLDLYDRMAKSFEINPKLPPDPSP
jgi:glyoxalase superfamily protein